MRAWGKNRSGVSDAGGEQMDGDEDSGEEKDEQAENPHERAGEDLIFEGGEAEKRGPLHVRRIKYAIAEGEEGAERAARKCAEEKIEGDGPARPTRFGGEWLDNRPPEEDGGREKAEVFDFMPGVGTQSEFECGRNVPGEENDGGENPAEERMSEKFPAGLHGGPAEEGTESGAHKPLRESVEKGQSGSPEEDERRNDKHQENVLNHVDGEGGFVEGGERGADSNPERGDAGEKSGQTRC